MKRSALLLLILSFVLLSFACDDDDSKDQSQDTGPANEVNAKIEGGSADTEVKGESEDSQEGMYFATVAGGELTVYLASSAGEVIFFTVDTNQVTVPGDASVNGELTGPAYITYTAGITINEGNSGSITVSNCPNTVGTVVKGSFNNIGMLDTSTETANGTFSGDYRATIVTSDGSAQCAEEPDPETDAIDDISTDVGPSPGPACVNDSCDGPCCPYIEPIGTCQVGCTTGVCTTEDLMGCMNCMSNCIIDSGLPDDEACMTPLTPLTECSKTHQCEGNIYGEDECLATFCCEEYKAAF